MNSICIDEMSSEPRVTIGNLLKQARQKHNVRDLNVISRELCISSYLLEALEKDDFTLFPSACYAIGFLKNYSDYLRLDANEFVARYEQEYIGSKECVVLSFPEAEYQSGFSYTKIAGVAALSIAILVGVWSGFDKLEAEDTYVSSPSINLSSVDKIETIPQTDAGLILAEDTPTTLPSLIMDTPDVRLRANEDVWVRLAMDDGTVVVEKILEKGENFVAEKASGLNLMTNNAAALVVYVDEHPLGTLGGQGEIFEGKILD